MKSLAAFLADCRGANAVEFALLAGPLMLILLGTMEFGRAYWSRHVIQEVAIAGARCMGVPQPKCSDKGTYDQAVSIGFIRTLANDRGVSLSLPDVTLDRKATCYGISGFSSVTIRYEFETALPGFLAALANGPVMQVQSCFPNQGG